MFSLDIAYYHLIWKEHFDIEENIKKKALSTNKYHIINKKCL
jgi:hypothetical protein